jgi:hypothetical protein
MILGVLSRHHTSHSEPPHLLSVSSFISGSPLPGASQTWVPVPYVEFTFRRLSSDRSSGLIIFVTRWKQVHTLSFSFLSFLGWGGTESTWYVGHQPRKIDDGCGAVGGMRIGKGNWSTRRKPAPVPLCPPQIPHDLTWARTWAAAVGSRWLTAWAVARPLVHIFSKWGQHLSYPVATFSYV